MRTTGLVATVRASLRELAILRAGETLLVGLSGGADSVALTDALSSLRAAWGFRLVAAHLDHGLRAGSDADVAFCTALCAALDVPLRVGRADVRGRATQDGDGIEDAARRERYAFLRTAAASESACAIAVAHTRDDQAETVLLHLLRGSGSRGLGGMRPRAGDVIRPLLRASRADVLAHLAARGLAWREDPTNADAAHARNRVRHELLPLLEARFNPNVRETLARTAHVLADEADTIESQARELLGAIAHGDGDGVTLDCRGLAAAPRAVARAAVRAAVDDICGRSGLAAIHVERFLALASSGAASGRRLSLPGATAVFAFGAVRIARRAHVDAPFACTLDVPGQVALPGGSRVRARSSPGPVVSNGETAVVAVPQEPLEVRTRRPGDRVRARGRDMSLRRFLVDRRVPVDVRESLPLVASGRQVLWIPGQPTDAVPPVGTPGFVRLEVERA